MMNICIGIVCEGDRDYDLFCALIEAIYPEYEFIFRKIQPDDSLDHEFYNGWKGVWSWCREKGHEVISIASGIQPNIDMFIIQMDSDVSRNEKEAHCACGTVTCEYRSIANLPDCPNIQACTIQIPCSLHEQSVEARTAHLNNILRTYFPDELPIPILFTFPSDSTDTWIVAALDEYEEYEEIENPWINIITHKLSYHGVKRNKQKKTKRVYDELINLMLENKERIFERCTQATLFRDNLNYCMTQITHNNRNNNE